MEKAKLAFEAKITTVVEVTPNQLREIANLLELSAGRGTKTETALVDLTDRITFAYRPSHKNLLPPTARQDTGTKEYVDKQGTA